jgi:Xaa-Pro aminopeptidase
MDRQARLVRARHAMAEAGCDALIVTKPVNVVWLTGFTGSNATVIVSPEGLTLITDGRYQVQADRQLTAASVTADVVITREPAEPLALATRSADNVGLESEHVTWAFQRRVTDWLGRPPVPTASLLERLRQIKDPGELERLRHAAQLADRALAANVGLLGQRMTEAEVARSLERTMVDLGADDLSFASIVAAGPNSALPHATPSDRMIDDGDLVVIDFGAKVDGYGSDMTRTFLVGSCSAEQRRIYDAVAEAQAAGVAAVRAGVAELAVDEACRSVLEGHDLADAFVHGTGHGIGLEIHEQPMLSAKSTGSLAAGMVVTVEPGVYVPGLGGVRVEDAVVVAETGCEPITNSPKEPGITVVASP